MCTETFITRKCLVFQNIGLMFLFSLYYQFCFDVPMNALKMIVEQIFFFFAFANTPMLSPEIQQASITSLLLSNMLVGLLNCAKHYPVFWHILELNLVTFSNLKFGTMAVVFFLLLFPCNIFWGFKTCDWKNFLLTYLRNPKTAKNQNVLCCSRACENYWFYWNLFPYLNVICLCITEVAFSLFNT